MPFLSTDIDMKVKNYFPTQVFISDLPEKAVGELNAKLLDAIYAERKRDEAGLQRSNFPQLGGWHSQNFLHKDPAYSDLVDLIGQCGDSVGKNNGYDEAYTLKIGTMWSIVNPPGAANMAHVHPNCLWSGVYYVQAPDNCGRISFTDPRTVNVMNPARYVPNEKRPKSCWSKVNVTPKAGKIIIFPSWLYHSVDPNTSAAKGDASDRIIISFNLNQRRL